MQGMIWGGGGQSKVKNSKLCKCTRCTQMRYYVVQSSRINGSCHPIIKFANRVTYDTTGSTNSSCTIFRFVYNSKYYYRRVYRQSIVVYTTPVVVLH